MSKSSIKDRSTENTNLEVDQKMRRHKRTADPETDQRAKFCPASPTTSVETDSTEQEVKRLKRRTNVIQERKDVKKEPIDDDKGGKQNKRTPGRSKLTSPPRQWISVKRLLNVENSLAFGMEMLPAFSKSLYPSYSLPASLPSHTASSFSSSLSVSQVHKSRDQRHGPNLSFLPPIDRGLFALLRDADFYCSTKTYTLSVGSLNTALQLISKGHVLNDMQCADPEDIDLVISYIQARLVVCYLRMKKPQLALEHAHRSIQLNPRHFQNHLRQAAVYRMLGKPCQAAKSVLTADWLYCLLGGTERHISTQLKLYWQAMLYQAQATEKDVTVMYTPYTGELTDKDISQAEEAFMKYHPTFTDFIYTDPRGGHVLPQTTDWLSVPAVPKHYLITLGFRRREDGLFLKKIHSRICPSFTGGKEKLLSPKQQKKMDEEETWKLCEKYEKILPVLDLMQATQINSGVCAGSGLIEWLQYSSLLFKLGYHREHSTILHRCQAQLATAPYLPQISTQQENTLLQALLTDIMDELGGQRSSTERVWNKMLKVGWLEDLIHSVGRKYLRKKAQRHLCREKNKDKAKGKKRSSISRELFPTPATEHKVVKRISPSAKTLTPSSSKTASYCSSSAEKKTANESSSSTRKITPSNITESDVLNSVNPILSETANQMRSSPALA
ncbi:spermatogenesis-associated protein 16-like isoform X4 [Thunnus maccoyii]|uniref:spermatogenesis-associated protein 16-like isoform X4 n=1 Tax=Thunnus maccoyii TaxID=8240 RepID=UPI001C4A9ABE|nr:spermatogenesis-associated protein 16-like isoform X4 [Thunnus maccoyii]